jgi:hypothetical protein
MQVDTIAEHLSPCHGLTGWYMVEGLKVSQNAIVDA